MGERRQFKTGPKRLTGGGQGGGTIMKKKASVRNTGSGENGRKSLRGREDK